METEEHYLILRFHLIAFWKENNTYPLSLDHFCSHFVFLSNIYSWRLSSFIIFKNCGKW